MKKNNNKISKSMNPKGILSCNYNDDKIIPQNQTSSTTSNITQHGNEVPKTSIADDLLAKKSVDENHK